MLWSLLSLLYPSVGGGLVVLRVALGVVFVGLVRRLRRVVVVGFAGACGRYVRLLPSIVLVGRRGWLSFVLACRRRRSALRVPVLLKLQLLSLVYPLVELCMTGSLVVVSSVGCRVRRRRMLPSVEFVVLVRVGALALLLLLLSVLVCLLVRAGPVVLCGSCSRFVAPMVVCVCSRWSWKESVLVVVVLWSCSSLLVVGAAACCRRSCSSVTVCRCRSCSSVVVVAAWSDICNAAPSSPPPWWPPLRCSSSSS